MRKLYLTFLPVIIFLVSGVRTLEAQNCDPSVPSFIVNLTGNPDSSWTSPPVQRVGQCCGVTPPDICVSFIVTLDPNSVSIVFNITAGAVPPGALYYQVNCGPQIAVGDTICLNGVGPHEITFCKPGNNTNEYTITAIPAPNAPDSITIRSGCSAEMYAFGYYESSITWTSVFPGPPGAYNSYLSCTSACDTVTVTPQPGFPPFIDYVVSGMAQAPCTTVAGQDTIRVYIVADLLAQINPQNPTICYGGNDTLLTVVPSGGLPPYTYLWSNGNTTSSTTVGPGTYWVQVNDATDCPAVFDTVTVGIFTLPITANAGPDLLTCSNAPTVQLNGSVVSASGGQWSGGGGNYNPGSSSLSTQYTPSASEITAGGTSLILVTTGNQGCPADTDTVQIVITPLPVVQAGPNQTVCSNSPLVALSGQVTGGSSTGQWSSSGTGSFSPNNTVLNASYQLSPADIASGSVTLTLTSTGNGGCPPQNDVMVINIDPIAVVQAGPDQTICSNSSATLAGQVTGGSGTGQWSSSGSGVFTPNNSTLNAIYTPSSADSAAGSVLLILTSTANGACPPDADTVQITITPFPVVQAGPDQTVCSNSPLVSLAGQVTGGSSTGQWSSSGTGSFSPNNTVLNASYQLSPADIASGSVTLTLTSTGNGGCPAQNDVMVINIDPVAVVQAGPDQTVCSNAAITLAGQVAGGSGTGQWSTSGSGVFTPNNTTLNAVYTPSAADSAAGAVMLILTSTANGVCPADADTLFLSIQALPVVNAGTPASICANNATAVLAGTVGGVTSSGIWSTGGNGTFSPNNTNLGAAYIAGSQDISNGSVWLVLTSTGNGFCPAVSDSVLITITPAPVVAAGPDQSICSTGQLALSGQVSGGSATGQWSTSGNGTFSPSNTSLNAVYTPGSNDLSLGTVTITLQATNIGNCSPVSDNLVVTIVPVPQVNAGPDQSLCAGLGAAQLVGQVTGGSSTGIWSSSGTGTFSPGNTTLNATYSPSAADIAAGFVTLVLTSTGNGPCAADQDTMVINITQLPVANAGSNISVCANNSTVFLAGQVTGGGGTGQWTTNGTGSFFPSSSFLNAQYQPSAADITAGTVTLTLTSTNNGGCPSSTDNLVLSITPAPVVVVGADQSVCAGSAVSLSGFVGGGSSTGMWSTSGSGSFSPAATVLNASYIPSTADIAAGTVTLILMSTNNGNCFAVSDTMILTISQPAVVAAGPDQTLCEDNLPFNLNATVIGGSGTGQWQTSGTGTFIPNANSAAVQYVPSAADITAGTVTLTYSSTNNGACPAASDQLVLTIHPAPVAAFTVNQTTVYLPNAPVVILNQSTGAQAYEWDFGDGSSTSLANPQYEYQQVGTYTITLVASNNFGCDDTASIEILATSDIVFPNAFTPNPESGNGGQYDPGSLDNNIFFPYTAGVDKYLLQIFNRWGELIFESNDLNIGWDGYYRGELCQQDTYVWKAKVTFHDGRTFIKVGDVTLLR